MRWTIFGRSPLPLAIVWFVVSLVVFVVVMNLEMDPAVLAARCAFGALSAYGLVDLVVRLNRYHW